MSINWHYLHTPQDVDALAEQSKQHPCLIFKHSTRCPISSLARHRLESDWDFGATEIEAYFLDLIAHRDTSQYVAEVFSVHHESPQVLLIYQGECLYDESHLDISVADLRDAGLSQAS